MLNVGYGLIEMVGGFISGSQALKADALDFLGDGLITFLGISRHRLESALARVRPSFQGLFLGVLGLGVLGSTAYRVLVENQPEAGLMGLFGIIALAVNVGAALALIPHRTGDANVRAVWLFSRNDAIGNASSRRGGGPGRMDRNGQPDLVVAAVIAGLFLQSSWVIVRDARADLRETA